MRRVTCIPHVLLVFGLFFAFLCSGYFLLLLLHTIVVSLLLFYFCSCKFEFSAEFVWESATGYTQQTRRNISASLLSSFSPFLFLGRIVKAFVERNTQPCEKRLIHSGPWDSFPNSLSDYCWVFLHFTYDSCFYVQRALIL